MKKILSLLIICIGIFSTTDLYACIECETCPKGFDLVYKCCKESNNNDCIIKDPNKAFRCNEDPNGYTKNVVACCGKNFFGMKKCVEPNDCINADCI